MKTIQERYLGKECQEIDYIKQSELGAIVGQGLAEVYMAQPKNPISFLGKWFINQAMLKKAKLEAKDKEIRKKKLLIQKQEKAKEQEKLKDQQLYQNLQLNDEEESFQNRLQSSLDVFDLLNDFCQFVQERTSTTGVYIGLLERMKRDISPEDNDTAHISEELPFHIRYVAASKGHEFMIKEEEQAEEGSREGPAYIEDVVRNENIFYFDVPKLGSYIAIPCTYNSCLFEESLDEAVKDAIDCIQRRKEQEEHQEGSKRSSEGEEEDQQLSGDIREAPYITQPVKYVICADTLGQDRTLTQKQLDFLNKYSEILKKGFFDTEQKVLKLDIDSRIARGEDEKLFLEDILPD